MNRELFPVEHFWSRLRSILSKSKTEKDKPPVKLRDVRLPRPGE